MQHLEQPAAQRTYAARHLKTGIEDLEKEAFKRGLPVNGKEILGTEGCLFGSDACRNRACLKRGEPIDADPLILLIDDEEAFRSVLKQVLLNAGYEVMEASNGAEGIKSFYERPADMIITDIIMPEKEGIETIIELKKAYPDVKLIAMSGGGWYGTDIDFDMAKKLGARTLDKPFALQELLDVVDELLN
jgi:CheY-like chemotaxis protein